jgi:hypothetical protein
MNTFNSKIRDSKSIKELSRVLEGFVDEKTKEGVTSMT